MWYIHSWKKTSVQTLESLMENWTIVIEQPFSCLLRYPEITEPEATGALPRDGCPTKVSNLGRKPLVRDVTKDIIVTLAELQGSFVQTGKSSRRSVITAALCQSWLSCRLARQKSVLNKKKHLEVTCWNSSF